MFGLDDLIGTAVSTVGGGLLKELFGGDEGGGNAEMSPEARALFNEWSEKIGNLSNERMTINSPFGPIQVLSPAARQAGDMGTDMLRVLLGYQGGLVGKEPASSGLLGGLAPGFAWGSQQDWTGISDFLKAGGGNAKEDTAAQAFNDALSALPWT